MANSNTPSSVDTISALKRLQRDHRELSKYPIVNIDARPIGDDLFAWTFTMVAPSGLWAGIPFHGHMDFTEEYPSKPPTVSLLTDLDHPNVVRGQICLDMLNVGTAPQAQQYQLNLHVSPAFA
jgi:ubiquitin-protein ligase